MKYKNGDKVKVHTREWFDKTLRDLDHYLDLDFMKDEEWNIAHHKYLSISNRILKYAGKEVEILEPFNSRSGYIIKGDDFNLCFEDWMFEEE